MRITPGFSTCPNDTFIFEAIIHQKVNTEGLSFDVGLADVEELILSVEAGIIESVRPDIFVEL